jgi:hypothetical protein
MKALLRTVPGAPPFPFYSESFLIFLLPSPGLHKEAERSLSLGLSDNETILPICIASTWPSAIVIVQRKWKSKSWSLCFACHLQAKETKLYFQYSSMSLIGHLDTSTICMTISSNLISLAFKFKYINSFSYFFFLK